jgi:hypothetical protein
MDLSVINLGIGLLGLMVINIFLGSIDSIFSKSFDWVKFKLGLLKSFAVAMCTLGLYGVGWLNPDVVAMNVDGQAITLLMAIYMLIMTAFISYAKQCIDKLSKILLGGKTIEEVKSGK